MDRYRILHFTSSLAVGGAEHHVLNGCRSLRAMGHEAAVCTISPFEEGLEGTLVDEGIPLFRVPVGSLAALPTPRVARGLRRTVRTFRPHLLHAHLFHAEAVALFASFFARAPVVVTRHSAGLEFLGWRRRFARLYASRVAACIAVSREAAEEAIGMGHPRRTVTVLPNSVDPQRFAPLEKASRETRRIALAAELFPSAPSEPFILIGSAGALKPIKNFPALVRAAAALANEAKRSPVVRAPRFVIFGDGAEKAALAALVRDLGIESIFALPGTRRGLEEVYPLLDLFVLASLSEGLPLALLEAMSSGVACVASDVGGIGEALSGAGALVPPGDEKALLEAVGSLASREDSRMELGRRARVRVLERFSIDIWNERLMSVYRAALGKREAA